MKQPLKKVYRKDGSDRLLPRFSSFIFKRSRTVALIWLCLTVFGLFSYTTLLKREGFPSITIPYSIISGTYFVNDAKKVDGEVAKPVSDLLLKDSRVKSVNAQSQGMFYSIFVQYDEGTDADTVGKELQNRIADAKIIPAQASLEVNTPRFGFTERGDDAVVSVYSTDDNATQAELVAEAQKVVKFIKAQNFADLESVSVVDPYVKGTDPVTGAARTDQAKFDRYAVREGNQNVFYNSVSVGILQRDGTDVIKLDDRLQKALDEYNGQNQSSAFKTAISATYAHDIKDQISELQKALLEGLLAVLIIGSIIIAVRASLITVIAMLTTLAIALGLLFAVGYTLNTITLFALILCLGLIVDDTIIMVEAIDAQRRRRKDAHEVIQVATRKVSRAMVAATTTAALSFAPLIFVGGILGGFIRAIPVTIISALLISLLVALIFIPFFAKFLLLGKKQLGATNVHEPAAGVEAKIASFIGRPMLWARDSRKKLFGVGMVAVLVGGLFIGGGMFLFSKVTFNIFPPSKDTNGLVVKLDFDPGTTIEQAEAVTNRADRITATTLGQNFKSAAYYANASNQSATLVAYIISYKDRDITSVQLAKDLNAEFKGFQGAKVEVSQLDVGPPASAFSVNIETDDREAAYRLANDMKSYLDGLELTRISGEKAKVLSPAVSSPDVYSRTDGKLHISINAKFDGTDTSALVTLAQDAIKKEFTEKKLGGYGLDKDVIKFDLGQEQENQDSFGTLIMAFPILLLVIYLVLCVQFRSLLQPLLIFMAIPFSLFGITLGLYLTDNAFGFFSMLGFFALIGLSIKNTILLTDYANQLRREGETAVDAAVGALAERFRPLIATSLTAVASLIPLMISSPFWEGLTVVLIFGLLSSTILVIFVFPYYYLGAEYLRLRVSRKACLLWLGLTIVATIALNKAGVTPATAPLIAILIAAIMITFAKVRSARRRRAA